MVSRQDFERIDNVLNRYIDDKYKDLIKNIFTYGLKDRLASHKFC